MNARLGACALFFVLGCGASDPPPDTPKPKPADHTEVSMQTVPIIDGGLPEQASTPVAANDGGTSAPKTVSSDPSDDPMIGGPQAATLEKSVAPIRPRLRACYKKALADQPGVSGTATFDATIGKDGHVSSARFVKREGLTEDMVGCLLTAVKAMVFAVDRKSQVVAFAFGSPTAASVSSAPASIGSSTPH